jgi:hypothetical protein
VESPIVKKGVRCRGSGVRGWGFDERGIAKMKVDPAMLMKTKNGRLSGVGCQVSGFDADKYIK